MISLREEGDEEVGSKRDCCCNSRLQERQRSEPAGDCIRLTFPCTTACSPYTMTLPGAETMRLGMKGFEWPFELPVGLRWGLSMMAIAA